MKTLFIEAIKTLELNEEKLSELEAKLPSTIYIAYSIQFKRLAEQVRGRLASRIKILGFSQVLGCSRLNTKAQAILLIGQGRFHALNLALAGKPVFIFDNYSISKIAESEIVKLHEKEKARYTKFLSSSRIGILISGKPGQENWQLATRLKKQLEKQGKKIYLFLSNNINPIELENFPGIECWINTACPGLWIDSSKIINPSKII